MIRIVTRTCFLAALGLLAGGGASLSGARPPRAAPARMPPPDPTPDPRRAEPEPEESLEVPVRRAPRKGVTASPVVRARYDFFLRGRRIWGHGVGRKIALTFDDGPHYQTTPRLLDHLDAFGVKAAFFVNSQRFNPRGLITGKSFAVLEEMHRRGHLIGNHSHSHPNLAASPAEKQRREIEMGDAAIEDLIGTPSTLFRPPFGALPPYSARLLGQRSSTVVMWNLGSDDDKNFNVSKVVNTLMVKLSRQGGGVILMHDTHYWTVEAVPPLLRAIRIESCRYLAEGEEPYEVVGLEYFYQRRRGPARTPSAAEHQAWLGRRAALAETCRKGPEGPLPEFLRGESP